MRQWSFTCLMCGLSFIIAYVLHFIACFAIVRRFCGFVLVCLGRYLVDHGYREFM
jgi:hypothetical protein